MSEIEEHRSEEERLAAEAFECKLKGDLVRKHEEPRSILHGTLVDKAAARDDQPASMLKIHPSLLKAREASDAADGSEEAGIIREANLEFPNYERFYKLPEEVELTPDEQNERIRIFVDYINTHVKPLKEQYGSYQAILSGETKMGMADYDHSPSRTALLPEYSYVNGGAKKPIDGHEWFYTGRDMKWLKDKYPEERWKYYLSMDQRTDDLKESGQRFLRDLLTLCSERKLSIMTKSFDHTYDSVNIYTWDKDEMAEVLDEVYQKYKDTGIFVEVPHFFQEQVDTVPQTIIGRVREPRGDLTDHSHSGRMGVVGKYFDYVEGQGKSIEAEDWIEACKRAGVRPEAPWDLDLSKLKKHV